MNSKDKEEKMAGKFITKRNDLLAQKVIKGLRSRNMSGYYAKDREEALKTALELIPEGSSVTMGGAMSVREIGLYTALKEGNYNFIDRDEIEDKRAAMLAAYDADVFLSSTNAMTEDGVLVKQSICDRSGSEKSRDDSRNEQSLFGYRRCGQTREKCRSTYKRPEV